MRVAQCQRQAVSRMLSNDKCSTTNSSSRRARLGSATSDAGSPVRRGPNRTGTRLPVTRCTAFTLLHGHATTGAQKLNAQDGASDSPRYEVTCTHAPRFTRLPGRALVLRATTRETPSPWGPRCALRGTTGSNRSRSANQHQKARPIRPSRARRRQNHDSI